MTSDKLSTSRSKRDFQKTAEPSGEKGTAPSNRRRFVIQKYEARRDCIHVAHLDAGQIGSRSQSVHDKDRTILSKSSTWQDYCNGQRPLEQAIKRLAKEMKHAAYQCTAMLTSG